jgi:hypothetical protein
MKRLPISKAVFKDLIEENCCYVDKTRYVKMMDEEFNKYLFISRPRRFGKSLYLDTLRAAYAGEKELFKGLYLEDNWDWEKRCPIINISFGVAHLGSREELNTMLITLLQQCAAQHGIALTATLPGLQFAELMRELSTQYGCGVVVLIDEYDKPILDNLTKPVAQEMRDTLGGFYAALKDNEQYIKLAFLTGVSRFSKTSIFSKLNNLQDLTLNQKYADLFGYTQGELERDFVDYLGDVDLVKLKQWYDGYKFLGSELYNPFDVLLFLDSKKYAFHWFSTGTPTFLIDLIQKQKSYYLPDLSGIDVYETDMSEFDIDHIDLVILLLQTGYLTIDSTYEGRVETVYRLKVPNKEVQIAFSKFLAKHLFLPNGTDTSGHNKFYLSLNKFLTDRNPALLEPAFTSFFDSVPHQWYRNNSIAEYEGYYNSMFYACFAAMGETIIPEDSCKTGDMDLTLVADDAIYIFEFKMLKNSATAMQQIKEKGYFKKYLNENKPLFLIGVEFDKEAKNISHFEWEQVPTMAY